MAVLKPRDVTLFHFKWHTDGPYLSAGDLARIAKYAVSEDRIRRDIEGGVLPVKRIPCACRNKVVIAFADARAYLKRLTLLGDAA